jgi:hypothetical protein
MVGWHYRGGWCQHGRYAGKGFHQCLAILRVTKSTDSLRGARSVSLEIERGAQRQKQSDDDDGISIAANHPLLRVKTLTKGAGW